MSELDNQEVTPQAAPNEAQPQYAAPEAGQQNGYPQQPYGYPNGYPQQDWNNGYYQQPYVPAPPREPNPLVALTLGIVAAAMLLLCASFSQVITIFARSNGAMVFIIVMFIIIMLAQLALAVVAMILGRRAMKFKPCGRASVSYIFGLVDTCLGGMMLVLFLMGLIAGGIAL